MITEGSANDRILLPNTQAIRVESRTNGWEYPLTALSTTNSPFPDLHLTAKAYSPHGREQLTSWIKGDHIDITGLPPLPIKGDTPSGQVYLERDRAWDIYALQTEEIEKLKKHPIPLLAFLHDETGGVSTLAIGPYRDIYLGEPPLSMIVVYDDGFGGYAAQTTIAVAKDDPLTLIQDELAKAPEVSPPLELIRASCANCGLDFPKTTVQLLKEWDQAGTWLWEGPPSLELSTLAQHLDWNHVPQADHNAAAWAVTFFSNLPQTGDLLDTLRRQQWPLVEALQPGSRNEILTQLAQQIFSIGELLPPPKTPSDNLTQLTAYLRAYGIHLSTIVPEEQPTTDIFLETPLKAIHEPLLPRRKLEENCPLITLTIAEKNLKENITLAYDPQGQGLKWPILDGKYLLRFQPLFETIPYTVRLRQARQINYPNSGQPYSFEADLIIEDKQTKESTEKTISMNHVHETWDGYRFYLAGIAPADPGAVKQVQIAVNHDPAKYLLTYPGGIILAAGMLMLFFARLKNRSCE